MPAQRLMLAVLDDALRILLGAANARPRTSGRRVAETREWVLSDDTVWPFSFRNLCLALDIRADELRRRLGPALCADRRRVPVVDAPIRSRGAFEVAAAIEMRRR